MGKETKIETQDSADYKGEHPDLYQQKMPVVPNMPMFQMGSYPIS